MVHISKEIGYQNHMRIIKVVIYGQMHMVFVIF